MGTGGARAIPDSDDAKRPFWSPDGFHWDSGDQVDRNVFGVEALPTEIILDHEGMDVGRSKGWGRSSNDVLARKILDALGSTRKARLVAAEDRYEYANVATDGTCVAAFISSLHAACRSSTRMH